MSGQVKNPRAPEAEVDSMFLDRWSPRAFSPEPLSDKELAALFEAARWAPSCFNEQPWLFVYGTEKAGKERVLDLLVEGNRQWADRAPVLMVLFAKRHFERNGKPNRHGPFDAGAAWMSLALQARRLGLYAHAMGGFDADRSYDTLGVSRERYEAMAAIAVGRRETAGTLPEELARKETPNDRKPVSGIAVAGTGSR